MINYLCLDICSNIILFTLLVSVVTKRSWSGPAFNVHVTQLIVSLSATLMHMGYLAISLWGPKNQTGIFWAYFFQYLFLFFESYVYPLAAIYVFIAIGIWYYIWNHKRIFIYFIILSSLPAILFLFNLVHNDLFYINENLQLIINNSFRVAYVFITLTMFIGVILIFSYKSYLTKSSFIVGIIFYPINFFMVCIQAFYPDKQFLLFVIAISCYMISSTLHRSEVMLSAYAKAHSQYTFFTEVRKKISLNNKCNFVYIKIDNSNNILRYIGKRNYSHFLSHFSRNLNRFCKENRVYGAIYYLADSIFSIPTEVNSAQELKRIFSKLSEILKKVILIEDFQIYVDATICIASYPEDIYNYEYLKFFSYNFNQIVPKTKEVILISDFTSNKFYTIKNEIETIINRALRDGNFELYFQPIYSSEHKRYTSAEALIRLNDPDFGFIPPSVFIPFAEGSKIIYQISDYVFKIVSNFISSVDFRKFNFECIEINLSKAQCLDPELVDKIQKYILQYNISPSKIRLEITEAALDCNPDIVERNIRILKELGVNLALDNYGTGYTNFKRLISLPLDVVKLDKVFIDSYENPEGKIIVDDTVKMLKELGKTILIEGVENKELAVTFENLKCDLLQGYYFSRPLAKDNFISFMDSNRRVTL